MKNEDSSLKRKINILFNKVNSLSRNVGGSIPRGGTTDQALIKDSDNDYDYSWKDIETGSGTGLTQQQIEGLI